MMKEILMGVISLSLVVGIRIVWVVLRSKGRKLALREFALQLGWTLRPGGIKLAATPCFSGKSNSRVENVMEGSASGLRALMFDYLYDEEQSDAEGGNYTVTRSRTIAAFYSPQHQLPMFVLRKKHLFGKSPDRIEVLGHYEFIKGLVLTGKDKPSVSSLFDPQLVSFLSRMPHDEKMCLEGAGPWLIFYHEGVLGRGKCLAPKQWAGFLRETSQIALGFFQIAAEAAQSGITSAA